MLRKETTFCAVPTLQEKAYFEMARELEGEIAQMEAENSAWQSRLSAQSHDLMVTRGELQVSLFFFLLRNSYNM